MSSTPTTSEAVPQFVTLTLPCGKSVQLPLLTGTEGPQMIDIRSLYAKTNMFTFDPGFTCTGIT
jgi:citrate synthase